MKHIIKIGTRDSQLAVWQATQVQQLLTKNNITSQLVFIKSQGDIDTITPLYEIGVQGIFTKSLDAALLNGRIDIAVHSMKDVPTKLAGGVRLSAILKRASYKDILIYKDKPQYLKEELGYENGQWLTIRHSSLVSPHLPFMIATSSIRRMAQWLHRYPHHLVENLRGNVNTRLRKLTEHNWNGAIFAAAGLERINLRPQNSLDLDWMLPAPAQGAITIACRDDDKFAFEISNPLNDAGTEICTTVERDFLRALFGGCSTPISALAEIKNDSIIFKGNICSPDGAMKIDIEKKVSIKESNHAGKLLADELLKDENAREIIHGIRNEK